MQDGPSQPFMLDEEHEQLFGPPAHKGCVIRLNVGGVPYVTTQSTLCSKGSNFFQSLLLNRMGSTFDETGAYFIDRDGETFRYILDFFRTGEVEIDVMERKGISRRTLAREAEFYCLHDLVMLIDCYEREEIERKKEELARKHVEPEILRKDGYYSLSNNNVGSGLCEVIAFFEDGKCVFSNGPHASNNVVVYHSVQSLPDLWKEVEVGEIYARFVTHSINRGRYWMEGHTMKLCLRNSAVLLAVTKGEVLYINSEDDDFIKYTFNPWP